MCACEWRASSGARRPPRGGQPADSGPHASPASDASPHIGRLSQIHGPANSGGVDRFADDTWEHQKGAFAMSDVVGSPRAPSRAE